MNKNIITMYQRKFEVAKKNIKGEIEMISKEMADALLLKNKGNRPINRATVECYKTEILNGWWEANGEPVIIDENGRTANGQQRLYAVSETGISVPMMVVRGVSKAAFDTMDQNRSRSNGQVYNLETESTIGNELSAVVKAIHSYKNGGNMSDNLGQKFSPRMFKHLLGVYGKEVEQSVMFAQNFKKGGLFTQSAIASLHYVFSSINRDAANKFMIALVAGDYGDNIVIRELREHFVNLKLSGVKINRNRPYVCGVIIKGWNAWRKGERLKARDYKTGNAFPQAI